MSFGFAGPSSSGKSTLAKEVAKLSGLPYFAFPTTDLMAEIGVNGVDDLSMLDRVCVQSHLLSRYWDLTQAHARPFITDRTPIDIIAYMLAEVQMHGTPPELIDKIDTLVTTALNATDCTFMALFTVRALPVYEVDPKRPPSNIAYHRHIEMLVDGATARLKRPTVYRLLTTKHEARVGAVQKAMGDEFAELIEERKNLRLN